jgi:ubiquinone/menaquinone biosynthesis C-methylase UbiE
VAMEWPLRIRPARQVELPSGSQQPMIDVRELMARLSDTELLQAADAYFKGLSIDSEQCHKPFSNIADAIHIHRNLALVLQAADLFRGADVLDFGCATGWLTLSLASLGCDAVGVDVAPSAIALANQWKDRHGIRAGGAARFCVYAGQRLPLDDASVDRVICFDAFHHVRDQAATLGEFARVLRPGGRIAMLEPGPNHSRTPQSQMEMSLYKVIENDVNMQMIMAAAQSAGLNAPNMLVQMQLPMQVPVKEYLHWAKESAVPTVQGQRVLDALGRQLTNTQCFFITKPGTPLVDSRQAAALAAELRLLSAKPCPEPGQGWVIRLSITNVGEAVWRTQPGLVGQVNLGLQLLDSTGLVVQRDYMRIALAGPAVQPGDERNLEFVLAKPIPADHLIRFDLVAEHVSWFVENGRNSALTWGAGKVVR